MKTLIALVLAWLCLLCPAWALTGSELTFGTATNVNTFTTASISPEAGQLLVFWFSTHTLTPCSVTSVSGVAGSWTQVSNDHDAGNTVNVYAYRGTATSTGTVTVNFGSVCDRTTVYSIWAFSGVDASSSEGVIAHHWDGAFNICSTCNLSSVISGFSSTNGVISFGSGGGSGTSMTPTGDASGGWQFGSTISGGSGTTFYAGFVQFKPLRGSDNNSEMTLAFNSSVATVAIVDLEIAAAPLVKHRVNFQ